MRTIAMAAVAMLCTTGVVDAATRTAPAASYAAALADPARPAADRARDAARKPAEVLSFLGVRPGDRVGDFVMGGGYFTRLLAAAVGPKGRVHAFQPSEFIRFKASYGESLKTVDDAYDNVVGSQGAFAAPTFPEPLDAIVTVQNYHDLHLAPFPPDTATRAGAALFRALKPGGVLVVVDHHAAAGSGTRDADKLHRIDVESVKRELAAAGFVLEAESEALRLPADPRTANVFDAAIRGRTDQFMLRFRKPKA
jgi:predicted methyltransferase